MITDYNYIIWHDNDYDLAFWVYKNSILNRFNVELRCIPKTNSYKQILDSFSEDHTRTVLQYIKFETPDIIIQKVDSTRNNPVLCVTEFMTHTPQWQHPAQRFSRLYSASLLKTPSALVLPERKIKWEKGPRQSYKATNYVCSPSVYELFVQSTLKNNTPTLIFNWPERDGYLAYDKSHPTAPYIREDIINWLNFLNMCIINEGVLQQHEYEETFTRMKGIAKEKSIDDFDTIEGIFDTDYIVKTFNLDLSIFNERYTNNKKTLVFKPNGLKCKNTKFRTDPYAGMLCAFDVLFCRDNDFKRNVNLLLIAKNVKMKEVKFIKDTHIISDCPFSRDDIPLEKKHLTSCCFTQPKYRRIYGEVADVIIFDDEVYYKIGGLV